MCTFLKKFTSIGNSLLPDVRGDDKAEELVESANKIDNYIEKLKSRMEPDLNDCFKDFQKYVEETYSIGQ